MLGSEPVGISTCRQGTGFWLNRAGSYLLISIIHKRLILDAVEDVVYY